jgi:hypothetical protein
MHLDLDKKYASWKEASEALDLATMFLDYDWTKEMH